MFERFTLAARTAVVRAQEEARAQGSSTIDAGHLLFGVLSDTTGVPAVVLRRWDVDATRVAAAVRTAADLDDEALSTLGIDLDAVRRRAEDEFGPGALDQPRASRRQRAVAKGHLPPAAETKHALEESLRAAVFGGVREIDSAQLFLGLLAVEQGTALRTLRRLGVTASRPELRRLVQAELDEAA